MQNPKMKEVQKMAKIVNIYNLKIEVLTKRVDESIQKLMIELLADGKSANEVIEQMEIIVGDNMRQFLQDLKDGKSWS